MSAPRLTVLMPTRDAEAHVAEALASIRDGVGAGGDVEVLVLDGESRDRTAEIARSFAPLTRVTVRRDGSLYEALNRGVGEAQAPFVGWLNADDLYSPGGPGALVAALAAAPDADVAYGDYDEWEPARNLRTTMHHDDDALACYRAGEMRRGWVTPLAAVWRKAALERLGGWNPSYRISGDQELWARAACVTPALRCLHLPCAMGSFRVHPGSLSSGGRQTPRMLLEELWLTQSTLGRDDVPAGLRQAYELRQRDSLRWSVWAAVLRGDVRGASDVIKSYGTPQDSVPALVATQVFGALKRRLRARLEAVRR